MKINNIAPIVLGILMITLIALATSCSTSYRVYDNKFHKDYCQKVECQTWANR